MPTTPRPAARLAVLACVAALATACSGSEDAGSPPSAAPSSGTSRGTSPSPTETPAPATGLSYVAMGDSYTAAPLVPSTDTTDPCLRSDGNYPHLVAAELGYDLADVSCAEATTTSLIGVQQVRGATLPAQFDALGAGTDLVTVSIGANDGRLFSTLVQRCLDLAQDDPQGSPCRDDQRSGDDDGLQRLTDQLAARTRAVVTGIEDRAPDAQVVVVTYPQLVPARGTCDALPLAAGDYPYARDVNQALSSALAQGGRRANADVVDVLALSEGHDICSEEPWVNGQTTDGGRALAFHPFAVEQEAVADALVGLVEQDGTEVS